MQASIENKILQENIEVGYVSLLGYDPSVRDHILQVLKQRRVAEDTFISDLQSSGQKAILSTPRDEISFSASLGNRLRQAAEEPTMSYLSNIEKTLGPLQSSLRDLITKSDSEILRNAYRH